MAAADVRKCESRGLARLIDLSAARSQVWKPEELGAVLGHQLSAPVEFDLGGLDQGMPRKLGTLASAEGLLLKSFDDLLHHPNPPVELLELTKEFAKSHKNHPDSPLPWEVATLLYFGSIVVAMMRCNTRITELDDGALRSGVAWAIEQPWVDQRTRSLFEEGLGFLDTGADDEDE